MQVALQVAQTVFYIISPLVTLMAVGVAYLALFRQSKPSVLIYYEPNPDMGGVIDLIIANHGSGVARNVRLSSSPPIQRFDVQGGMADEMSPSLKFYQIPVLSAGQELRYVGGRYDGILAAIGDELEIAAEYEYRTPLKRSKKGVDHSVLDVRYMAKMDARSDPGQVVSDAMQGRNNTVFQKMNEHLRHIAKMLESLQKLEKQ